jgi:hypothetical protein
MTNYHFKGGAMKDICVFNSDGKCMSAVHNRGRAYKSKCRRCPGYESKRELQERAIVQRLRAERQEKLDEIVQILDETHELKEGEG